MEIIDDVFTKALTNSGLIRSRDALHSDYIPQKLVFRDSQLTAVAETLAPLLNNSRSSNLLLYGKTGTGKTVLVKYVLQRLQERADKQGIDISLSYTNTRVANTEYRILYELGQQLNTEIPFTGLSSSEASGRLLARINEKKIHAVLVFDEIDFLVKSSGDKLLYEMSRANERLNEGFITLIGISNDLKFKEFLDPRVLSSLSEEEVVFPPYTVDELKLILKKRSETAFHVGTIDEGAINLCAALAGMEHGDARRAVDTLRVAGEVAERQGANNVEEKHVRTAVQKIDQDRMTDALISLPLHQKILLLSIRNSHKENTTGPIHNQYQHICSNIGTEPLTLRRISGLLSELTLLGVISSKVISHGRYGRTKAINLLINNELLIDTLQKDNLISPLLTSKILNLNI